jgi:hypothetical protein
MSLYLAGTFTQKKEAAEAIAQLKADGYDANDLTVFSDEPVEFPRGVLDRPSHMSLVVVLGAIVSFLLIVGFVYYTQYNYRLVTGGMPIFSFWPASVVFYEITMLGSVLTTTGWFVWESGLLRRRDRSVPMPSIQPDVICLRVRCAPAQFVSATAILERAGAKNVAKLEAAA